MNYSRNDGGPAFPRYEAWKNDGDINATAPDGQVVPPGCSVAIDHPGMSLRDHFATEAMAAMVAGTWPDMHDREEVAKRSYLMADAMLKARTQ